MREREERVRGCEPRERVVKDAPRPRNPEGTVKLTVSARAAHARRYSKSWRRRFERAGALHGGAGARRVVGRAARVAPREERGIVRDAPIGSHVGLVVLVVVREPRILDARRCFRRRRRGWRKRLTGRNPAGRARGVPPVDARGVAPRRIRPGRDARHERDATRRAALRRPRAARTRIPRTPPEDARATRRQAPPRDPHHGRHRTRPRARRTRTARPHRATRRARHARRRPRAGTTPRDPRGEDADDDARRRRSRRIRSVVPRDARRRPTRRRHAREPPPRNRPRRIETRGRTPRPRTRRHLVRA